MANDVTLSNFKARLKECADAIEAQDMAQAYSKYAQAEALHSGLENQVGHEGSYIRRRERLDGLKIALDAAAKATQTRGNRKRIIRTRMSRGGRW